MPLKARPGWMIGSAVGGLALVAYLFTLAPTITWRNDGADSGDLVTAAYTFGIPHPPGYPLYTLIAAAFARLPFDEPARGVNLLSAICAAGAVTLLYIAITRILLSTGNQDCDSHISAASVALVVAFSPLFWSQAVLAEVYALNALFVAALLGVLFSARSDRTVWVAAILGLGLAHHLSIGLLAPSAVLLLLALPRTRSDILRALIVLFVPLLLYLYLPLRAFADPPINWGDPRTLQNFWWTISAAPYHPYLFNLSLGDLGARVAAVARGLFAQFNVWGVALGLWGIAQMWSRARRQLLALGLGFVLIAAYSIVYVTRDSLVYLLPAFMLFAAWIAFGLADLARHFSSAWARGALVGALLLMSGYNLATNFSAQDLSRDHQAFDYAQAIIAHAPQEAVILADGDAHLFALQYYRYVIASNAPVTIVSAELLQFDWYYDQVTQTMPGLDTHESEYGARLAQVIETNRRAGHAVFTTASGGWFATYQTQPEGQVFQILGRYR